MRLPGFTACGSCSQRAIDSGVLSNTPAASVARLPMCVRSGPAVPLAAVPAIVWQFTHVSRWNSCAPRSASGPETRGTAAWAARHASNTAAGSATTRNRIHACWMPQYSAQAPSYTPGAAACTDMAFG